MVKELICISCPMGCHLKVDVDNKTVTGNTCKRGEIYGLNEVTNPVRVVTSTIKVNGGELPVVPVKTAGAIPKKLNFECMKVMNETTVNAPIKMGDILIKDVLGTGIDVVASRDIECN
ncbi:MAG: DUF1667 domain-containing protein [Clostridium baratii]|uniref:Molybdopterin oxidoreductase n=1 Tax=Clostridium baratii str. Sullivan TaxID=1415775 RepID=A0A0A7FTS3_9CLOT|nr:DUF1667 domain-containing protein [Clostridium baratii]AIY82290.1 hypothetical protein U729_579 [Clostridium baratii str. Sullivan]MBS6007190.1 DUF1667 domain-containing protein [Clostridium baratii]MDU1054051.1 DUF1667 domain-containing protein [Clostridium baratii]MDU4911072.1 DUF1667 domain-containing protein [Clostridium baratii]CUP49164.1 molybdopterin oxidoreductase%2C 4Fe-4S cluster-binding subunit [Clostridium baratii]